MRSCLPLLVSIVAFVATAPLQDTPNVHSFSRGKDAAAAAETEIVTGKVATNQLAKRQSPKADGGTKDSKSSLLTSISIRDNRAESGSPEPPRSRKESEQAKEDRRTSKKNRKHKAIFVDYPVVPQFPYNGPPYDLDYDNDNNFDVEGKTLGGGGSTPYRESNIFYIRLPPTPYMFVPGLGYISQPPTYSTSNLRPQLSYARPGRPKPIYHHQQQQQQQQQQSVNPFIKLPIDFVSNGKPTSVYQWKKKNKKPTDSPITNLDSLSEDFVSNGKPTSVYQWQTNLKPIGEPDDTVNNLDKGPYTFNGKPASFFLLKPDGTSTRGQPLLYPDYRQDNSYY